MITDYEFTFSNDQAFIDTAVSTNVIDLSRVAPKVGAGQPIEIAVTPTVAYGTVTSVNAVLQTDADAAFSNPVTIDQTGAIVIASLIPANGSRSLVIKEPVERYVRLNYVVVGGSTNAEAGRMHAALVFDRQTNQRG